MANSPRAAVLLLWLAPALAGANLAEGVRRAIDVSAKTAFWGIQIEDLESGTILFGQNADRLFVPASNTKLFTAALALVRLGPEYRFVTTVTAGRPPDDSGAVHGRLRLVGGGDPNLSARPIPYTKEPYSGDPLAAMDELAAQVAARGVRRVLGDIVGDDTAYVWQPFPPGWAIDDPVWDYGAAASALSVNDNTVALHILPGAAVGDLARLTLSPEVGYYDIDNRIRTVAAGDRKVEVEREPGSRQVRLWGTIPAGSPEHAELLGIADPAVFAARALYEALVRRGIAVEGSAVAEHLFPNQVTDLEQAPPPQPGEGVELARRVSAPLIEDLRVTAKVSQNLHAEMALRAVGRARRNVGSREAGLDEMKAFLAEAGVDPAQCLLHDGSGLTRLNLVAPGAAVALLRHMWNSGLREDWLSLLPVGGRDGTLSARLAGTPAAGRIRAKTGSLSHVSALSGYAERKRGGRLVFSILVNNYPDSASGEVRAAIDKICSLMVE
jgi:D-alanyl-D-alanine carboxypeptidase/D-alanyl-D-alanine-endopeptidase (penicillin-binding protein 4)